MEAPGTARLHGRLEVFGKKIGSAAKDQGEQLTQPFPFVPRKLRSVRDSSGRSRGDLFTVYKRSKLFCGIYFYRPFLFLLAFWRRFLIICAVLVFQSLIIPRLINRIKRG